MFIRKGIADLSTNDSGKLYQLCVVAIAKRTAIDIVRPRVIRTGRFLQRQTDDLVFSGVPIAGCFYRAKFERALGPANNEPPVFHAVDFLDRNPDRRGSDVVFHHSQSVVNQSVMTCLLQKRRDAVGFPQQGNDNVDQIAGKNIHRAAFELRQPPAIIRIVSVVPAHYRMDLKQISEPAVPDSFEAKTDRRIVPIHISKLENALFGAAETDQFSERVKRFSAGFIKVDVQIALRAPFCGGGIMPVNAWNTKIISLKKL